MSTILARPESALKRAEELIHVGQKQAALQALHDLITSKRCRSWQKPLEKVMMRYVELCVDLRKGRFAKDGLIQYSRIVCQQQLNNVSSLEEVVKHFMHLSSKKAEEAAMNHQAQALDVHDLEAPEDLMLSYVGGKDRPDTPWLKFLWETYRTVLEVLGNNSKLEALYAMAAHKAFQFCKQYKRSTEFRRLCEMIRNHLVNLNRSYRDRPDLTAPESCQLFLDTRVEQLKVAAELSLSQEAFRSVEDIHGLMSMVQRTPKPSVLAVYYAKLTEIFWTSESYYLYHAYAWLELFNLHKSHNKNLTRKDLQLLASSALLAALSVTPYYDHKSGVSHLGLENEKERSSRMANLLNFSFDSKRENREKVSRTSLLSELAARGVVSCASQEVQDLYNLMEHEFHPLDLASKVQPLLSKISTIGGKLSAAPLVPEIQLSQYQPALEKFTTLRVLQQASRVFHSMRIDTLSRMIPFFDFNVVEKIAVDAVKHSFIAMKVDHLSGAVRFGNTETESDVPGATHLIGVLADSLNKVSSLVHPPVHEPYKLCEDSISLAGVVEKEHQRLLARKSFIEKRKEDDERQILEKEKAEEAKRLSIQKKSADEERERLLKERRLREQQRIRQEIEDRKQREIENSRQNVTKQGAMEFVSRHLGYRMSRQGMEKRLEKLAKRMGHLERARRQEEAPLIEEAFRKRVEEEKLLHEQELLRETELSEQRHAGDWLEKKRLSRLLEHKNAFQERVVQRREAEFLSLTKEREERINQLISSRRLERDTARKLTYYLKMEEQRIQRAREEEEERIRRAREEEEQRIQREREEEERKRREEAPPARCNNPWRRRSGPPANSYSSGSWRH